MSFSQLQKLRNAVDNIGLETVQLHEDNNNHPDGVNIAKLLNHNVAECEEQYSNSSSLESRTSLTNNMGSQECDEEESGSTSCSEDSFEITSICSEREKIVKETIDINKSNENLLNENGLEQSSSRYHQNYPMFNNAFQQHEENDAFQKIRKNVAQQINNLDTGLPKFDFNELEKKLSLSAKRFEETQAKHEICKYATSSRQKLGVRLPVSSKNLQVCFMNELSETETENGDDSEDSDLEPVGKSKSVPNFRNLAATSYNDDLAEKADMTKLYDKLIDNKTAVNDSDRCKILQYEAQRVMNIAEEVANDALTNYRKNKSKASEVPRQARQYLSKTKLTGIQSILGQIEDAITRKNMELVNLLIEKDNLHMEHDSLRVDIDDFTNQKSPNILLDMNKLLTLQKQLRSVFNGKTHQ